MTDTEQLFSYGTLQQENVQRKSFGRLLEGKPDILPGYSLSMVAIEDAEVVATSGEAFHPIIRPGAASDEVPGTVFTITKQELAAADAYEVDAYKRTRVRLKSGIDAWVYIEA